MLRRLSGCIVLAAALLLAGPVPATAQRAGGHVLEPPPAAGHRPGAGEIEGMVTALDPATRTIAISGQTYGLDRGVDISRLRQGDQVRAELRPGPRGTPVVHAIKVLDTAPDHGPIP